MFASRCHRKSPVPTLLSSLVVAEHILPGRLDLQTARSRPDPSEKRAINSGETGAGVAEPEVDLRYDYRWIVGQTRPGAASSCLSSITSRPRSHGSSPRVSLNLALSTARSLRRRLCPNPRLSMRSGATSVLAGPRVSI